MSQRTMEMRVGMLILFSLALLAGFIVVMGGMSLESTFTVNVEFDNPGGLKSGAPVKMSGISIGRVSAIELRGRQTSTGGAAVRVVANVETKHRNSLYTNDQWFITTQGVLGEQFLAVEPGVGQGTLLQDGAVVRGVSPPRLDLLLSEGYELLHQTYRGISENQQQLRETFDGLHKTLVGTGRFFEANQQKLDKIIENLDVLTQQLTQTTEAARAKYVDNPEIDQILLHTRNAAAAADENLGPLLRDAREMTAAVKELTNALGGPEEIKKYRQVVQDVSAMAATGRQVAGQAQAMMNHVQSGKGTIGAVLMDEALYDDMQEFLRDIKHNPWKVFWKE